MWGQVAAVSVLPALALCFNHQDNELFRLRDRIVEDLGDGTTFYSWLGLKKGATIKEINRAYRGLSRRLHPDRNPGVEANERFARLNQVYKTLKSPLRDRYDYYLSVGFPNYSSETDSWFYRRYRPGLIFVALLLALFYTAVQFLVLKTSAIRKRQHISGLIHDVRAEAAKSSQTGAITSITKISQGSKVFVVHPTGEVYFEGTKLSPELVEEPTFSDTHAGKLIARIRGKADTAGTSHSTSPAQDYKEDSEEELKREDSTNKESTPLLKKGAARRRPAGARGKAKIF